MSTAVDGIDFFGGAGGLPGVLPPGMPGAPRLPGAGLPGGLPGAMPGGGLPGGPPLPGEYGGGPGGPLCPARRAGPREGLGARRRGGLENWRLRRGARDARATRAARGI